MLLNFIALIIVKIQLYLTLIRSILDFNISIRSRIRLEERHSNHEPAHNTFYLERFNAIPFHLFHNVSLVTLSTKNQVDYVSTKQEMIIKFEKRKKKLFI